MALLVSETGKLLLRNGKLFVDTNGTDCCCGAGCCDGKVWPAILCVQVRVPGVGPGDPCNCMNVDFEICRLDDDVAEWDISEGYGGGTTIPLCDDAGVELVFRLVCVAVGDTFVFKIQDAAVEGPFVTSPCDDTPQSRGVFTEIEASSLACEPFEAIFPVPAGHILCNPMPGDINDNPAFTITITECPP